MADLKVVDAEQLDADLTIVADAIRSKGGTTEQLSFPQGMKQAVEAIQSGEGSDNPFQYATMNNGNVFKDSIFPDNYEIDLFYGGGIGFTMSLTMHFQGSNIKKVNIGLGACEKVTTNNMFYSCKSLEEVNFTTNNINIINGSSMFNSCSILKSIHGEINFSQTNNLSNAFNGCPLLKDVTIAKESIKATTTFKDSALLSNESIQSVIDALATVTTTQTLTLHEDVKAKLTQAQLTTITSKNWTLA